MRAVPISRPAPNVVTLRRRPWDIENNNMINVTKRTCSLLLGDLSIGLPQID